MEEIEKPFCVWYKRPIILVVYIVLFIWSCFDYLYETINMLLFGDMSLLSDCVEYIDEDDQDE